MKKVVYNYFLIFTIFFCLLFVIIPKRGHFSDMSCWQNWAIFSFENGLSNIYQSSTDYLPLYHYILFIWGLFQNNVEEISKNIYSLKLITVIFHFVITYFIFLFISKKHTVYYKAIFLSLFYLFNISVLYNSIVWGQVDDILTCFVFISCYFAYKKKVLLSLIFYTLAINFKLQAIIFLPIIGLMLLPTINKTFSFINLVKNFLPPLLLQLLIVMPFMLNGTIGNLWNVVLGSFGKYPVISMNAYNFWDLVKSGDLMEIPDSTIFLGLSYKNWGLLMFLIFSGIALFPLSISAYTSIVKKTDFDFPIEKYLLICGIIPLLFFYFNTQMHERYSHPALAFIITFSLYNPKAFAGVLASLAYFLNLEDVLKFMELPNYGTLIFNRDFISILFLITLLYLFINLYTVTNKKLTYETKI